jgi:hypothetical protein
MELPASPSPLYELLGPLGQGGMGVVWRARHRELGREVALKTIRRGLVDDKLATRFRQEAQTMARVRHPNLIQVYDCGIAEDQLWIALELVEGSSLDRILADQGPLEPDTARRVVVQVAGALAALHQARILHRDVKPANVMLEPGGRAVLMDLGLARAEDLTAVTETGAVVGSPSYMPVPQLQGQEWDASCDVYSLGISWWELLEGRRPWAIGVLLAARCSDGELPLPPFSGTRGEVPAGDRAVLQAMVRFSGADRPVDARDVVQLLDADGPGGSGDSTTILGAGSGHGSGTARQEDMVAAPVSGPSPPPGALDRARLLLPGLGLVLLLAVAWWGTRPPAAPVGPSQEELAARELAAGLDRHLASLAWHPRPPFPSTTSAHLAAYKEELADPALVPRMRRVGDALLAWIAARQVDPGFPRAEERTRIATTGRWLAHLIQDVIRLSRELPAEHAEIFSVFGGARSEIDRGWLEARQELFAELQREVLAFAEDLLRRLGEGSETWRLRQAAGLVRASHDEGVAELFDRVLAARAEASDPAERLELLGATHELLRTKTVIGVLRLEGERVGRAMELLRELSDALPPAMEPEARLEELRTLAERLGSASEPAVFERVDSALELAEAAGVGRKGSTLRLRVIQTADTLESTGGFADPEAVRRFRVALRELAAEDPAR